MSSLYPNQVIVSAHLTEKASLVGQFANTYVFKVAGKATKLEIKKAIENPTMAVKYAVRDVEKSLRKQAANVDESQEYEYMPRLANAIKKYQQAGTFVAPTDDEIDAGSQPNKVDKYGCNNYAGYTWCTFNKKCQRHWEEPCYYHAEVASNLRAKE